MLWSSDLSFFSFATLSGILVTIVNFNVDSGKAIGKAIVDRARDNYYLFLNLVLPYRAKGKVILPGRPGHAGIWPQYYPASSTDSRSPCPGLNAMANHGILPRDGRRISYNQLKDAIIYTYNFAPTAAEAVVDSAFWFANGRDYVHLSDILTHNVIEHDSSFTRPDLAYWPDQSKPCPELIDILLSRASDGKKLTFRDQAYNAGIRRVECSATNSQFQLPTISKFFDGGNATALRWFFDGIVDDLEVWLKEERFPDGWEPKCRLAKGLCAFHIETGSILYNMNIDIHQRLRPGDAFILDQKTMETGQKRMKVR